MSLQKRIQEEWASAQAKEKELAEAAEKEQDEKRSKQVTGDSLLYPATKHRHCAAQLQHACIISCILVLPCVFTNVSEMRDRYGQ